MHHLTNADNVHRFLQSLAEGSRDTHDTYRRALREFLRWYGDTPVATLARDGVFRYRTYLEQARRFRPATVATYLAGLRRFLDFLAAEGLIPVNPALRVPCRREKHRPSMRVLSAHEIAELYGAVDRGGRRGMRDIALLMLIVEHGLSEIELVRADVADYVSIQGLGALRVQRKGKRGKEDVVSLGPDAAAAVKRYLTQRGIVEPASPLFMSDGRRTRGVRMTTRGIRERIHRYVKAGLRENITARELRHTAGALMARAGLPADEIKHRLGLGSLAQAARYLRWSPAGEGPADTATK